MDIHFDGFQHTIPAFWMILLMLVVLGISFWTYRGVEGISTTLRWLLISLRSAAFILLLLLLLNPVLSINEYISYPARIALLLDNSQSTAIEKGDYNGTERYSEVIAELMPGDDDRYEHVTVDPYRFDSDFHEMDSPSGLTHEGTRTDIDQALAGFMDIIEREEAVILVSDGIVTSGRDPTSTASRFPVPVYTVGIGDTTRRNDIVVQRVTNNPSASLNSRIPVEATILNEGFPDRNITVQLRHDDTLLADTTIRSSESRSVQQIRFELSLEEEGLQQFHIHVPEIEGEWTAENNTNYFSVDVRDDRIRILHLANEVHPDIQHLRTFLREDRQISLENRTWITDDQYVEGDLPERPDTLDLVILHGFPHRDLSASHASEIADRFSDNALLLVGAPGQDITRLSTLFPDRLPLQFDAAGFNWHDVQFEFSQAHSNHAVLDFEFPEDLRMSPVRSGIRNISETGSASTMLQTSYRGNVTDVPLLSVRSDGNHHISHLNGYNFYQWSLSTREESRRFWEDLLNNLVKWTAASPDEELLDLVPADPVFQIGEPVIMNAYLRDEAGEPEENGVIELEIDNDAADLRRYVMSNEGEGRYQLEIDNLPEGSYTYRGTATREEREIDTRSGRFTIGGVNRELLNTTRNDEVLRQIARLSDGGYLSHEQADELFETLEQQLGFEEERTETVTRSLPFYRHPFWFVLIVVLLTIEWSLRKYRALP